MISMKSRHDRINYKFKCINEYKNNYFSDVYTIFVDDIDVGERHIDTLCKRDLFFIRGKKQYSQDVYEYFGKQYPDKFLPDEDCIIIRNEKDLLFFLTKV